MLASVTSFVNIRNHKLIIIQTFFLVIASMAMFADALSKLDPLMCDI